MTDTNSRHLASVIREFLRPPGLPSSAAAIFVLSAIAAQAADLRVMKTGLGEGTITASGINCGTGGSDCNETGISGMLRLDVTVGADAIFTAWGGDCAAVAVTPPATPPCFVTMDAFRSVRANFDPDPPITRLTPAQISDVAADASRSGIGDYLSANPEVDTPAEFIAALPNEYKLNWILMSRSESLQTGTAESPRILLPSADATRVFTVGMSRHDSYPGAHPSAIEFMQWDPVEKNFRFHEVVLARIPELAAPGGGGIRFPERLRGVTIDDPKCFACHSTRNVKHTGGTPGTTGSPPGLVKFKSKPNWDTYDSWGGMLPFNRDRIFQGTVEAAAFRQIFNLWTWQNNAPVRSVIEQLQLQPDNVPNGSTISQQSGIADHRIRRDVFVGGVNDGHIVFGFDPPGVAVEPQPTGSGPTVTYEFNRRAGTAGTPVARNTSFLTLHHSDSPTNDEGRGVQLFDLLGGLDGQPNAIRIGDELADHRYATGNVRLDARPLALAINRDCYTVSGGTAIGNAQSVVPALPAAAARFFDARNGLSFDQVHDDTRRRAQSLTRRKADIQRATLDRDADEYVYDSTPGPPIVPPDRIDGLIRAFGARTAGVAGGTGGADASMRRLRQEVFRRDHVEPSPLTHPDETVMGRVYADREDDSTDGRPDNTAKIALYRYFLEPLGASVDKWSMGVRGRSRTYTFADILDQYTTHIRNGLEQSLTSDPFPGLAPPFTCTDLLVAVNTIFATPPPEDAVPSYTDIQRVFNKSCIECHGGLGYPPYHTYGTALDLSEDENPPAGERRLWRSLQVARSMIGAPACPPATPACPLGTGTNPANSFLYQRITDNGLLEHPYNPAEPYDVGNPDNPLDPDVADERCPYGLMPCGGPPLSKTDIETFRRWIIGDRPNTEGDPHIKTIEDVHYDFQSAGEFTLLRGEGMELQARQTAVTTAGPLDPNPYTGLSSCVSVNTAVAMRVGGHRVSYQPEIRGVSDAEIAFTRLEDDEQRRLILRVDGKPVELGAEEIALSRGGRITRTTTAGGIEVHYPGGTGIVVTPHWWERHQIWYMNINLRHARATEGIMGAIPPGNWLPALSDGNTLGPFPASLAQRHQDLYETFADSWRVDSSTSLFDYEPGLTPESFVVDDWPVSQAQSCLAPAQPGGPAPAPAPTAIARTDAEQLCAAIVDPNRRDNCVQDVIATGEPGFADSYLATEKLELRPTPAPAVLTAPIDSAVLAPEQVDFEWAPGGDGPPVTYRHCIWHADEIYDFNRCLRLGDGGPLDDLLGNVLPPRVKDRLPSWTCLALLLVLLLIVLLLIIRLRRRALIPVLISLVIGLAVWLILCRGVADPPLGRTVEDLEPGKVYFWKVVAETEDGVVMESPTRRFETQE